MRELFGQSVFSAAGQTYFWEDVVLAAMLWGEWSAIETRTSLGLACLARSRRRGEKLGECEFEKAADRFRYERGLLSGDETKAWLERWGLTVGEWMEFIRWTLLRERSATRTPKAEAIDDVPVSAAEIGHHVACEAVCSGDLARLARKLASRVAVADRAARELADAGAASNGNTKPEAARFDVAGLSTDLWQGHSAEALREKVENIGAVDRRYTAFLPRIVTPKAVAEQIRIHYMDWIWLEAEAAWFATVDMAKEAALGVRVDGMALAEVAAEVGRPCQRNDDFMDAFDSTVRNALLPATPGELVGPFFLHDAYVLINVLGKVVPSKDNPETAKRARRAALRTALDREVNDRVRWHWRL
jgi:hypothetical protein